MAAAAAAAAASASSLVSMSTTVVRRRIRAARFASVVRGRAVIGASASASASASATATESSPQQRRSVRSGRSSFWEPALVRSVQIDFRPKRIILLRHGESLGNIDDSAYVTTPDWRVPLTDRGREQASGAGRRLAEAVGPDGRVFFYYSPYRRTTQTLEELCRHLDEQQIVAMREEPRISEQQFGNFQNVQEVLDSKQERHRFGRFYYRFPSGESGLDVYSRVSSFITTLVRDCHQYNHLGYDLESMNVVIVTHGLTLRLFLMRWFQWTVEDFEESENPANARLITMRKTAGPGGHVYYELDPEDRRSINLPESCGVPRDARVHRVLGGEEEGTAGGGGR